MTTKNSNNSHDARLGWAIASPFLLALVAFTFVGIFFLPALCVYLDGRSRTYTAAVSLVAGAALAGYFLGTVALAASICVVVATAAVAVCSKLQPRLPFAASMLISAAGGAIGMLIFVALAGKTVGEAFANSVIQAFLASGTSSEHALGTAMINYLALIAKDTTATVDPFSMSQMLSKPPSWLTAMTLDARVTMVRNMLLDFAGYAIPALALSAGMLMGGLGYFLSNRALAKRAAAATGATSSFPAFAAFKIPAYAVISMWLLQIAASVAISEELGAFVVVYYACSLLLNMLMTLQALALFSFLLNRKRVFGAPQMLILTGAVLFLFWLLPFVGIVDAIFSLRLIIARIDILKARGKQVFTPEGLEELRRMDEEMRKEQNDDKDGKGGDE